MDKLIKEQVQILANKFVDSQITPDDVFVRFDTAMTEFFNELSIVKDILDTKLFEITTGVYRETDNMGLKCCIHSDVDKMELIRYLTSPQGVEEIEKQLKRLLDKVIIMD